MAVTATTASDRHKTPAYQLRMPDELKETLRRMAESSNRSLNQEIVYALRQYVSQERTQ